MLRRDASVDYPWISILDVSCGTALGPGRTASYCVMIEEHTARREYQRLRKRAQ